MPERRIVLFPDAVLSKPCQPIRVYDKTLQELVDDLWSTLKTSPGVGLAAPQIGVVLQVAVIDVSKKEKKHGAFVMVNPVIKATEGLQIPREGCLSIPDYLANVKRHQCVTVLFFDEHGRERTIKTDGFEALAIQHEVDHLNGKLFLDRVANLKTDIFRRKNISPPDGAR